MRSLRRRIRRSLRNRSETPTKTRLSTERLPRKKPIRERVLCLSGRRESVGGGTQRLSVDLSQPEAKRDNLFSCTQEESDMTVATLPVPETNPFLHLPEDVESRLKKLEEKKPVIFCGDLNVAHTEIDLKNPKTNRKNAGFTDEERSKFTELLDSGYIDTYRYFYPDKEGVYSWWSYRFKAREKNAGWRIDYFCVSKSLKDRLAGTQIHTEILGSDHCPVELQIKDRDET